MTPAEPQELSDVLGRVAMPLILLPVISPATGGKESDHRVGG